jgi:hypothetical protein
MKKAKLSRTNWGIGENLSKISRAKEQWIANGGGNEGCWWPRGNDEACKAKVGHEPAQEQASAGCFNC